MVVLLIQRLHFENHWPHPWAPSGQRCCFLNISRILAHRRQLTHLLNKFNQVLIKLNAPSVLRMALNFIKNKFKGVVTGVLFCRRY